MDRLPARADHEVQLYVLPQLNNNQCCVPEANDTAAEL